MNTRSVKCKDLEIWGWTRPQAVCPPERSHAYGPLFEESLRGGEMRRGEGGGAQRLGRHRGRERQREAKRGRESVDGEGHPMPRGPRG